MDNIKRLIVGTVAGAAITVAPAVAMAAPAFAATDNQSVGISDSYHDGGFGHRSDDDGWNFRHGFHHRFDRPFFWNSYDHGWGW